MAVCAGVAPAEPGFDFRALSEFSTRLLAGGVEHQLLEWMLSHFTRRGLLKVRGRQLTDATHFLAAIRTLNRLPGVGEPLREVLNALATVAPDWLRTQISPDGFAR